MGKIKSVITSFTLSGFFVRPLWFMHFWVNRWLPRFQGSTRDWDQDWDRDWTPEHILVFRALLEIEIELRNTSLFLGLYLRSRSRSASRKRSHQSTDEARSAPVRPRKKITWKGDIRETKKQRNKHTSRLLDQLGTEGRVGEKQGQCNGTNRKFIVLSIIYTPINFNEV